MKHENSRVIELNHIRSRSSPWCSIQDNSLISNLPAEESNLKLGSALPKLIKSYLSVPKLIKPPSLIAANPFLKAAKKIDQQTASIPWDQFSNTLKQSKSNFARIKEIYWPARPEKFLNTEEKKITKKKIIKNSQNKKSCQNSPAIKTIETSLIPGSSGKTWTCVKMKNFIGLNENKFLFNDSCEDKLRVHKVKARTGENDGRYCSSALLKKFMMKKKEVDESLPSTSEGCSEGIGTAPFAVVLRGNKVRSNMGNGFIPVSSSSFTPNHFLRKNENLQ